VPRESHGDAKTLSAVADPGVTVMRRKRPAAALPDVGRMGVELAVDRGQGGQAEHVLKGFAAPAAGSKTFFAHVALRHWCRQRLGRQINPQLAGQRQTLRVGKASKVCFKVRFEVGLSRLAEREPINCKRAFELLKFPDLTTERQRGHVPLDAGAIRRRIDPVRYEITDSAASIARGSVKQCIPWVRKAPVEPDKPVGGGDVLADGVTFVPMNATLTLLEVDGIGREVPVDDCVAVKMEIETLLADRGRGQNERPKR
jgi:hypothetical protein